MNEATKTKLDALNSEIDRHLAVAHDGTAIQTILSALKFMLAPPPEIVEHDPSEEPHGK